MEIFKKKAKVRQGAESERLSNKDISSLIEVSDEAFEETKKSFELNYKKNVYFKR